MLVICAKQEVINRYGAVQGEQVWQAAEALGTMLDVSGLGTDEIRAKINEHPQSEAACLIGDYALVPPFVLDNPTFHDKGDDDRKVPTDAPYGARPGSAAEFFLPSRPISRIPDSAAADAAAFIQLLTDAKNVQNRPTPAGTFEHASSEFAGAAQLVHQTMPGLSPIHLSPPQKKDDPVLGPLMSKRGRMHFLLHGSAKSPKRASLWGLPADTDPTVSATSLRGFDFDSATVLFSSCYSAMLDSNDGDPPRTADDQVALACLAAGAKIVYGCTRANWIDISVPFNSFGTALAACIWSELRAGKPAAQALLAARTAYAKAAAKIQDDEGVDSTAYILKTLMQMQCYGHPLATL